MVMDGRGGVESYRKLNEILSGFSPISHRLDYWQEMSSRQDGQMQTQDAKSRSFKLLE
jgi:hypothetical protein